MVSASRHHERRANRSRAWWTQPDLISCTRNFGSSNVSRTTHLLARTREDYSSSRIISMRIYNTTFLKYLQFTNQQYCRIYIYIYIHGDRNANAVFPLVWLNRKNIYILIFDANIVFFLIRAKYYNRSPTSFVNRILAQNFHFFFFKLILYYTEHLWLYSKLKKITLPRN